MVSDLAHGLSTKWTSSSNVSPQKPKTWYFDWVLETKATRCIGNHNHYILLWHIRMQICKLLWDNFFSALEISLRTGGFICFLKTLIKFSRFGSGILPLQFKMLTINVSKTKPKTHKMNYSGYFAVSWRTFWGASLGGGVSGCVLGGCLVAWTVYHKWQLIKWKNFLKFSTLQYAWK